MAYQDPVWAILGTIDGANSHIAIRVALKAEVVMMNSGRHRPDLHRDQHPVGHALHRRRPADGLSADRLHDPQDGLQADRDHSGRVTATAGSASARSATARDGWSIRHLEMAYKMGSTDFSLQLERLKAGNLDAVVHWGDAAEGALILNQMRKMGMMQPYFGCDRSVSDEFVELAGANADGVSAAFPWNPERKDAEARSIPRRIPQRFNEEPETYAAHAYDGMNMLIWAIQVAG